MEFHLDVLLCSNLGNQNYDAGHIKNSRGPHLARGPQVPHLPPDPDLRSTAHAADKDKLYLLPPELFEKKVCSNLEMKLKSTIGWIQRLTKLVRQKQLRKALGYSLFLLAVRYKLVFHYHRLPHGA